ncbi:sialic acid-binding Ig-like lectin 16 [Plectropomus leopardus]|uniref:sialic acid-binding Ig-like lectin 16 n=1 Tax=Plectropomus leopardus TaxID=160734 RepID=UPI001C4B487D|nr:sialic acid-binding Ig-like lectin 16 [Plectropomus leopardus]
MFPLIWVTLLFVVRGNSANKVASSRETKCSQNGLGVTVSGAEITAEAGLCIMIPCNITTDPGFTLECAVLHKCDPSQQNCSVSDKILHLVNTSLNAQSGSRGRVSFLEPDLNQRNCSIIINDVTASDSGSYQLRLHGILHGSSQEYTSAGTTITVKGLTQKPTVMIPPLREGQRATLTCTAPGLCSGSDPKITWTWTGAREEDSHITGNITAFKTEAVTAVTQRHSSTLTFNSSAEHHGTNVTCKVSLANNITTEETVTLNVTYVKEVQITGNTNVDKGKTLNLTCSVESFPPALITWTKLGLSKNLNSDSGSMMLVIPNVTAEYSGRYICTAQHLNNSLMAEANITVMYVKQSEIIGKTTVKEGDALNLTCIVESFPPSLVIWTKYPSNNNVSSGGDTHPQNNTGSATLVIPQVTGEHAGQYTCTAKHLNTTFTTYANVTVTFGPKILNNSGCINQLEVLTCVCISEGVPLPTIKWPLLENYTEYSVTTTVSNHGVNSTTTLTTKYHSNTVVECVSSNENGEVKRNFIINKAEQEGDIMEGLRFLTQLEIIFAFLVGALLSAIICCLARKCHRKQQRIYGNLAETLEMVTSHEDQLVDASQAVEDYQAIDQVAAEAAVAVALGKSDGDYSKIDFSLLKRRDPEETRTTQESTETEYAEIKELKNINEEAEESQDGEGEEEMTGEDEDTKHCVSEEKEGEDMALYSNVKIKMSQI